MLYSAAVPDTGVLKRTPPTGSFRVMVFAFLRTGSCRIRSSGKCPRAETYSMTRRIPSGTANVSESKCATSSGRWELGPVSRLVQ